MGIPVIGCDCRVCTSLDFRDKRQRSSVYIRSGASNLIIDTGPDLRFQLLEHRIRSIGAVLFTHSHKDHTGGIDDLRAFGQGKKSIPFHCDARTRDQLACDYRYIFDPTLRASTAPSVEMHVFDDKSFQVGDLMIQPLQIMHGTLPISGFRINDFTYVTDCNYISPDVLGKIRGSSYVVLSGLQRNRHQSHYSLGEALQLAEEEDFKNLYLTHISHQLGRHAVVEEEIGDRAKLAYDGLTLEV